MVKTALIHYIEDQIIPLYQAFDKAHQEDHARTVITESLKLARYYEVNLNMVYAIAAYHDIGLKYGREKHHLYSGELLLSDTKLNEWFTPKELKLMCQAIEDHRASAKHAPRSIYGRIVAEADRIINPDVTFLRALQYGIKHYPEKNKEEQYERFVLHMKEKYSEKGYLKLWIPHSNNAAQLKQLRDIIANSTQLRSYFDQLYALEIDS